MLLDVGGRALGGGGSGGSAAKLGPASCGATAGAAPVGDRPKKGFGADWADGGCGAAVTAVTGAGCEEGGGEDEGGGDDEETVTLAPPRLAEAFPSSKPQAKQRAPSQARPQLGQR